MALNLACCCDRRNSGQEYQLGDSFCVHGQRGYEPVNGNFCFAPISGVSAAVVTNQFVQLAFDTRMFLTN